MTQIDKNPLGSFCWVELGTTNQDAAKKFYGSLFGWSPNDNPMGPGEFYTIFRLDGRDAAAAYTLRADQQSQGVPPHWMLYVAVENVDKTAHNVKGLGGTVVLPPFDVFDIGRMAVLQDPTGAHFCAWQPLKRSGIGVADTDGALCWADLSTPDPGRASVFYSALFGWTLVEDEKDPSGYVHIKNGEQFIGGIPPAKHRQPGAPPHWLPYFLVSDVDATAAKAKLGGANLFLPPTSMENVGRFSVIADPQGAVFAIFKSAR